MKSSVFADDVKVQRLRDESPAVVYFLAAQVRPEESDTFALRTSLDTTGLSAAINAVLGE